MKISFFGSSILSSFWNGAATYYRGIIKALHMRGHQVTFYEPKAFDRQKKQDIDNPDYAEVVIYEPTETAALDMLHRAKSDDMIVKASGVGVLDDFLEDAVLRLRKFDQLVIFWDVDAPATLYRVQKNIDDPFRSLIPLYDCILTYGGGQPVIDKYTAFGARDCFPIYNALDSGSHYPVEPKPRFEADLAFLGNRLPDRESRVELFFLDAAAALPNKRFLLGGSGWSDKPLPPNVNYIGHVSSDDHNAFNSTPIAVMNICRSSMAEIGYSPPTRVFEAAGAGACIISDDWEGIDQFLIPQQEVLTVKNTDDVVKVVGSLTKEQAKNIGSAALQKVSDAHTYRQRALEFEKVFTRVNSNIG